VLDASFKLRPGEIVGLAGLLGSGRSTLLKTIFGAVKSDSGSVRMAGKEVDREEPRKAMFAGIAYVPENRLLDAAFTTMSVTENLGMATTGSFFQRGRLDHRSERRAAHTLIKDYRVKAPSAKANLATLSGGNQQKVILARWLRRNPRLILLDEPTQGVDIGARQEIWQLIRSAVDAGACALVATSDLDELATFCDRALVMQGGQITAEVEPEEMTEHHLEQLAFSLQEEDGQ
jgi:ribose transport system ATP-binding protein